MSQTTTLHFEAQVPLNKTKMKRAFISLTVLLVISIVCVVWSHLNWDEYTYLVKDVITGEISTSGIAYILFWWGICFAIAIPVMGGLMWMTLDFKNPALAVNKDGLFINREGFKQTFLKWDEFERIDKVSDDELRLYMKNPEEVVSRQPGFRKVFLKQTYVKEKSAITITSDDSSVSDARAVVDAIRKYSGKC